MINFLCGLPRSGSTLLGALLNQSRDLYVTPTNDLLEMVVKVRDSWTSCDGFRSQGLENLKPSIRTMLKGMMQGFYHHELSNNLTILDKCRGWPAYIELIEEVLERKIKIVCPIRDLKEVAASFERLRHKNVLTAIHGSGSDYYMQQTVMGRTQYLFGPAGTVGIAARQIQDAFNRGHSEKFLIVPYKNLLESPQAVCIQTLVFMGLKPIEISTTALINHDTRRDVDVWGLPLHRIRIDSVKDESQPWQELIPPNVAQWIDTEFASIQELIQR